MPMQPRPWAETARPWVPRVRVCMPNHTDGWRRLASSRSYASSAGERRPASDCNPRCPNPEVARDPTFGPFMLARRLLFGLCLVGLPWPSQLTAQAHRESAADTAALQRLLVAEDARGTSADGIAPLLDALSGPDTLFRRLAVRGLGRFQRPEFGRLLLPLLGDSVPAVRAEAATALAQSLRRVVEPICGLRPQFGLARGRIDAKGVAIMQSNDNMLTVVEEFRCPDSSTRHPEAFAFAS